MIHMAKVNRTQNLLDRLDEIAKAGVPYRVKTGDDLKDRGSMTPFQVLNDGKTEVVLGIEANQPNESITLPFVEWDDRAYGRRGGGRHLVQPSSEIHAIYDHGGDCTHYFLLPLPETKARK